MPIIFSSAIREALDTARLCADYAAAANRPCLRLENVTLDQYEEEAASAAELEPDVESELGILELQFDPNTHARFGTATNARAAALLGMDWTDLRARLESDDAPLPLTPLDAVAVFLHALGTAGEATAVRYYRLVPPASASPSSFSEEPATAAPPPALVCHMSGKTFDDEGRVIKVISRPPGSAAT